jgi:hypothetical protein
MYFTVKKIAIWVLLLSIQIAICWGQAVESFEIKWDHFEVPGMLLLNNTAKSKANTG